MDGKLLSGSHSRWESTGLKHYSAGDILYDLTESEMSPGSSLAGRLDMLPSETVGGNLASELTSLSIERHLENIRQLGTDTAPISTAPVLPPPLQEEEDQVAEDFSFLAGLSAREAIRVIADITTLHGAQSAELWESDTTEGGKNRPTVIAAIQAKIQEIQETTGQNPGQNQG